MKVARQVYAGLAWLFVLGVIIQVFLAGIGIFGNEHSDLDPHETFGFTVMSVIPVLMFIAALVGRMRWTFIGLSVVLFVLVGSQSAWVIEDNSRWIKAIHPTMSLVMFALAHFLAQRAMHLVRGESTLGAQAVV